MCCMNAYRLKKRGIDSLFIWQCLYYLLAQGHKMHSERPPDPPQNQLLNQLFGQWKKITFFFVIYGVMAMLWDDIIVKSE